MDYSDDLVAVYFRFKGERYFLEIHLSKDPETAVSSVWTESGHETCFVAISDDLTFEQLTHNINLHPLTGWSKGQLQKNGKAQYRFSKLAFNPIKSQAYSLERQLDLLLSELEKHSESVSTLSGKATVYISVFKYQYVSGNAGVHFDIETIKRLSRLNLSVDIDTLIVGNALREEDE